MKGIKKIRKRLLSGACAAAMVLGTTAFPAYAAETDANDVSEILMAEALSDPEEPVAGDADYTAVDEALAAVPKKLSKYSDDSIARMEAAIAAVDRSRMAEDQEEVDRMAENLWAAIEALTRTGWHTTKKGVWYCNVDEETWPADGWEKIDGRWYYFDKDGYRQSGWVKDAGKWYYLSEEGTVTKGWAKIDGVQYFFRENGVMKTGWLEWEGNWYFFRSTGAMKTGWLLNRGCYYFFRQSGIMLTGWKLYKGEWYYFGEDGTMSTGWVEDGGAKYYIQDSGSLATDGWLVRDGHSYHFNKTGKMDKDTTKAVSLVNMPGYYISPMYAGEFNSTDEKIEAMIRRAYDYKNAGTVYKICCSQKPGQYADCSGLVMQCLYAAGFDPSPATPKHHALPENEYDSRTLYHKVSMKHVPYSERRRGDLIFYRNPTGSIIIHVAIYLGDGKVIESWPPAVTDKYGVTSSPHTTVYGVARPFE